jgi:AcrR family transcriptional regulator
MPKAESLNNDLILDTTTELLRRYGPDKTSVVDVAKALGVTHGSLYRYFPDKAALFDAVMRRWLPVFSGNLPAIAAKDTPADERLHEWLMALIRIKHNVAKSDPEMFAKYHQIAERSHSVIREHIDELVGQIRQIIEDGNKAGLFNVSDTEQEARTVFSSTVYYHHPYHVLQQLDRSVDDEAERLVGLVVEGLKGDTADSELQRRSETSFVS